MRQLIILLLFFALALGLSELFVMPFEVPVVKASVSSGWYYRDRGCRVEHNVTGSMAGDQTGYQMNITIVNGTGTSKGSVHYTRNVSQSDFDDVRFTWYNATSGRQEEADYWCEEVNSGRNATFWVEIAEVSNARDNVIYVYYGNSTVTTTSNVNATFIRVIDGDKPVRLAFPMDGGSGNIVYDKSGNDNDGTIAGASWVDDGKFGKALSFDGNNDYLEVADDDSLDVTDEITIETWVFPENVLKYSALISKPNGSGGNYQLQNEYGRVSFLYRNSANNRTHSWKTSSSVLSKGNWYHIVLTLKFGMGNGIKCYVNGIEKEGGWETPDGGNDPPQATEQPLYIGGKSSNESLWEGLIDEVRIYNRTLTEEEVSDLYNYYGYVTASYTGRVLVRKRIDPEPVHGLWGSEEVPVHDIAVVGVVPSSTVVIKGDATDILVKVKNEGTYSETFNITAYYDSNIIDTQANVSLEPGADIALILTWNTTGVFPGEYNISANTSIVSGEIDTHDNIFTGGAIKVVIDYPKAYFTYSPMNPLVNETVVFNATLSSPNGGIIINYTWDFGDGFYGDGVIVFHNYSKVGIYNVTLTVTDSEEVNNMAWVTIAVSTHNISIVSATPSTNEVCEGQLMDVTVVVQNNGNFAETFNATIYANATVIQTQTVSDLVPAAQTTLTFIWNTTGVSPGNYTVKAEISIIHGETDTDDNFFTDGTVKLFDYPLAYFTYLPINPIVGETVTFNATESTPNGGTIVNHTWDFGDGENGSDAIVTHTYNTSGTHNITLTVTDSEGLNNTAWATIAVLKHSVTLVSVTPFTNEVCEGQSVNVTVVVQNNGNFTETFHVTTYANNTVIQTQPVSNLAPATQTALTFVWNTAGVSPGIYTIKAEASVVLGETYAAQTITVYIPSKWHTLLVAWLISVPPLIWVSIGILLIVVALFRLRLIEVKIERPLEPAEELKHQIDRTLQPLAEKDKRFNLLQQFLYLLLETNPPPKTLDFLKETFPIIIKAITEPK